LKRLVMPLLLAPGLLFSAVCSAVSASQPISLSSVLDQQATPDTATPPPSTTATSSSSKFELLIGPEASVYFPTSSKAQDAYGDSWSSIGFGIGSAYQANSRGSISPFLTILYNTHDGNRAFVLPFGVGYSRALTNGPTSAYYGIDAAVVAADQRAVSYGVHSGFSYGAGLRPLIGYEFGKHAYVQGSYLFATEIKNFDLSGASLEAGYRF